MPSHTPSYRLHKPTGQAVVTLSGRDHYLGRYDSPESRTAYDRLLAEWLANGRRVVQAAEHPAPAPFTVSELILGFMRHVRDYYVKDGKPTTEANHIRLSMKPLRKRFGTLPAAQFGPLALKAIRDDMIEQGLTRVEINLRVGRIARCFRWGVENELVPPDVHHGLKAVKGLHKGRSKAKECRTIRPVEDRLVDAVKPHVSRQVWAMVEVQRLTGMRSGEVSRMRTRDIDRSRDVWAYVPESHKTDHHGKRRRIFLGPQAQAVLAPWLRADPDAYLFDPREAMAELSARRREARKTPMTPSQRARKPKSRPKRGRGVRYTTSAYAHAITSACLKAGIDHWHPHQLRHSVGTKIRREFDLDTSRVVLGHSTPVVTEVYADIDEAKAAEAMRRVG